MANTSQNRRFSRPHPLSLSWSLSLSHSDIGVRVRMWVCLCVHVTRKLAVFLWPFHTHSHKYSYCSHRSHLVLLNSRCKIVTFRSHLHRIHECKQKAHHQHQHHCQLPKNYRTKKTIQSNNRKMKWKTQCEKVKCQRNMCYVDWLLWKQTMDIPARNIYVLNKEREREIKAEWIHFIVCKSRLWLLLLSFGFLVAVYFVNWTERKRERGGM